MDDFRKIFYGVLIGFIIVVVVWVASVAIFASHAPQVERTPIPTLNPATLPPPPRFLAAAATSTTVMETTQGQSSGESETTAARPSNPGGVGQAVNLTGDPTAGQQIFANNCQVCHGAEGKGGNPNPGSTDGTIPALNPIDPTIASHDVKTFTTNIDLFVEHGSTPEGTNPTFSMPAFGDQSILTSQQIADVIAYVISLNPVTSAATPAPTPLGGVDIARPSNPGGPGEAVNLTGDSNAGQQTFAENCQVCHGAEGTGGNPNPGSSDGTIPPLNPIDSTMVSTDSKAFAANIDLFVEHGSTPEGTNPTFSMPAFGDKGILTSQQIANVIAYIISLNPTASAATPAPTPLGGVDVARPSNPGGPGEAVNLTGDATVGQQLFATNCQACHGAEGKGGNPNPGSSDGTIPPLNPIDSTMVNTDIKTFATNIDLFVEHGSTPEGTNPTFSMPAFGDKSILTPQQIADLVAYVISLNPH